MALSEIEKRKKRARRSNALARAKSEKLAKSVWEERIIIRLLCQLSGHEKKFPVLSLSVSELGLDSNSGETYKYIKKACSSLGSTTKIIEDIKNKTFTVIPYFSEIKYQNGVIFAQFNAKMRPHLLELKPGFTTTDYEQFRRLKTINGQILYNLLHSWHSRTATPEIPVEKLHELFSATKYQKQHWNQFRQFVLNPAMEDVRQTGYWFEPKFIKSGRKITAVQFLLALDVKLAEEKQQRKDTQAEISRLFAACTECIFTKHQMGECKPNMRTKLCKFCVANNMRGSAEMEDAPQSDEVADEK